MILFFASFSYRKIILYSINEKNPEWRMIPKLTFLFDAYNSYEVKSLMWTLVKQWSDKITMQLASMNV